MLAELTVAIVDGGGTLCHLATLRDQDKRFAPALPAVGARPWARFDDTLGRSAPVAPIQFAIESAIRHVWYLAPVVKTTIYLPDDLHRELKRVAKERGTSEAELIRTAVRHELLGAPPGQAERAQRRARLLAAIGTFDSSVYPAGYLDEVRAGWRS